MAGDPADLPLRPLLTGLDALEDWKAEPEAGIWCAPLPEGMEVSTVRGALRPRWDSLVYSAVQD